MKHHLLLAGALFLASAASLGAAVAQSSLPPAPLPPPPAPPPAPQAFFSPLGGCTSAIVREINSSAKTIDVEAYDFSSAPIAGALLAARKRGVRVRVIFDRLGARGRGNVAALLSKGGIAVWVDARHAIFHDKVLLIDGEALLTGSFNFTQNAERRNAENLLVLREVPTLVGQYEAEFERHRAHSTPLATPATPPATPATPLQTEAA